MAALNVYLGEDSEISKNAMSKFFCNLSMQALSRSKDRIQLKFTNTGKLYRAILDEVLNNKMHVEREEVERIFRGRGRIFDVIVSEQ